MKAGVVAWSLGLVLGASAALSAEPGSGTAPLLLTVSNDGELQVLPIRLSNPPTDRTPAGILIWKSLSGREGWTVLRAGEEWPSTTEPTQTYASFAAASRTRDSGALGGLPAGTSLVTTIQLPPLEGSPVIRRGAFLTPRDQAELISTRPTVRRPAERGQFPARTAVLLKGNSRVPLLTISFAEGADRVSLASITDWPADCPDGLPPGQYTLRMEDGLASHRFTVLTPSERQQILGPILALEKWTSADDPVAVQFAAESLLTLQTDEGEPRFLGDVLDRLESVPAAARTPALDRLRGSVQAWLENLARDPGYSQARITSLAPGPPTGLAVIDAVRGQIAAGQWTQALQDLDRIDRAGDDPVPPRVQGLSALYRAVVLGEAGVAQSEEAIHEFQRALQILNALPESPESLQDRLRALNNLANLHLVLAQSGLGNHAFQMAAGVERPIGTCVHHLRLAQHGYAQALSIAESLGDAFSVDALNVNLARTEALSADLIRILDVPDAQGNRQLTGAEQASAQRADTRAEKLTRESGGADAATRAAAWEIRAQIAYRRGGSAEAIAAATAARQAFARLGDLAGVETTERLLGLAALTLPDRERARTHFQIAHELAELHRRQYPPGEAGLGRAGYFARHSFACEQLVQLALDEDQPSPALQFAEQMKARTARDLLGALGVPDAAEPVEARSVDAILADWPADTAAVEYFLGAERAWGFVIQNGRIRAFELNDPEGQPVKARALVDRVRQLLADMEGQSQKMMRRLVAGRGFDHDWQDQWLQLRQILLPDPVLAELRAARQVVVIPQHVLHYVPFAALVVARDDQPRSATQMVSPRFLLDEPFALIQSPSLTAWDLIRRRPAIPSTAVRAVGLVEIPGTVPLPGVARDLKNLRDVYGDRVKGILEGEAALERNARLLLGEPGTLMFATHGLNDPNRPLESHLLLLPDPVEIPDSAESVSVAGDDGRLTAREIFANRVQARLIVLSACYSGLGDRSPQPGDDLFGLQRAFLHAGARTVLSGLWDVYDGTAPTLIRRFHEGIASGTAPSEALARSQREFLAALRTSREPEPWLHPYFWAVFCVAGSD